MAPQKKALSAGKSFSPSGRHALAVSCKIIGCTGATPHIAHHLRSAWELFSAAAPLTTEHQMWTSSERRQWWWQLFPCGSAAAGAAGGVTGRGEEKEKERNHKRSVGRRNEEKHLDSCTRHRDISASQCRCRCPLLDINHRSHLSIDFFSRLPHQALQRPGGRVLVLWELLLEGPPMKDPHLPYDSTPIYDWRWR